MKLSTRGHYAITAMMELALTKEKLVTLADISGVQHISVSYLEQIFANLRKKGLVKGTRGPGGGYMLARPVNEISVADIISSAEEDIDTTLYAGRSHRLNIKRSQTETYWINLSHKIYEFMDGITLGDCLDQEMAIENSTIKNEQNAIAA